MVLCNTNFTIYSMHTHIDQIVSYTNSILKPQSVKDYCPNGIQVATKRNITSLVSGVTACQAFINAAIEEDADTLLVHHGLFWNNESSVVDGMKKRRLKTLLKNDIGLLAYHLPLDIHPTLGNNAMLARIMHWKIAGTHHTPNTLPLLMHGKTRDSLTPSKMKKLLHRKLMRLPIYVSGGKHKIKRIAWCTGAGQGLIDLATQHRCDAFISGEISERTTHVAREQGIHYFAAGHHATERFGIQALGDALAKKFGISHKFIDIDNPA